MLINKNEINFKSFEKVIKILPKNSIYFVGIGSRDVTMNNGIVQRNNYSIVLGRDGADNFNIKLAYQNSRTTKHLNYQHDWIGVSGNYDAVPETVVEIAKMLYTLAIPVLC